MNTNGFLLNGPDGKRMSASQIRTMNRAMDAIFHNAKTRIDANDLDLVQLCQRVINEELVNYPVDRSCHTCDNFSPDDRQCAVWNVPVPGDKSDAGCDKYTEDIPF